MKTDHCPLCNKTLIKEKDSKKIYQSYSTRFTNTRKSYANDNVFVCDNIVFSFKLTGSRENKLISEPHYYVDWYKEPTNNYPWYEYAIWRKKDKIFNIQVDRSQIYEMSSICEKNSSQWSTITKIKIDHEHRPINEIIQRLEKIIIFA